MRLRAPFVVALMLAPLSQVSAQFVWSGTGNITSASGTTFGTNDPLNWVGGVLPTNGADVSFLLSAPPTVNVPVNSSVGNVTFATNTAATYTVNGQNGSVVQLNGGITVNASGNSTASGNVTIGSGLTLALSNGTHTLNVANSGTTPATTLEIDSNIVEAAATAGLAKTGAGALALSGASTFTGGVSVSSGTLYLLGNSTKNGSNVITSGPVGTGTLTLSNGATLATRTSPITLDNALAITGNVILDGASRANSLTLTGVISGTGGLTTISPTPDPDESQHPIIVLQGTNTFTGNVNVDGSSLILDSAGALPSGVAVLLGGSNDDGYLGYTENSFGTFAAFKAAITANSNSNRIGDSIIGIDSHNPAAGRTVSDNVDLSGLGAVYFGSSTNATLSGSILSPSGGSLFLTGVDTGYLKITSALTGTNGITSVSVSSSESEPGDVTYKGYVELTSGASNYTGGTKLQGGYLLVGGSSTGPAGSVTSGPLGTGLLTVTGSADTGAPGLAASVNGITLNNTISISVVSGNGTTSDNKLVVGVPTTSNSTDFAFPLQAFKANSLTLGGAISGAGGLDSEGSGTLTLTGTNTYTGGTTINFGTVQVGNGGTLGSIVGNVTDNGFLNFNRSDSAAALSGVISGTGAVSQTGNGTLTLSGANTYTGGTSVKAGVLSVASLANGGTGSGIGASTNAAANLVLDGGVLQYTGGAQSTDRLFTIGAVGSGVDASGTGALTFTNTGAIVLGNGGASIPHNLILTGTSTAANTFDPVIGDDGSQMTGVTKNGTGTWVLAGTNTFTGATTINGGTLVIAKDANLGAAPASSVGNQLSFNGGTLETTASFTLNTLRGINLSSGGGTLNTDPGTTLSFAGPITGGNLTKTGTGTLTLSGTSSYGATIVNAGTVHVSGSLSSGGDVTVGSAGTFELDRSANIAGPTQVIRGLFGSGNVTIDTGSTLNVNLPTLNVGPSDGSSGVSTFSGNLTGAGSFLKNGASTSTFILTGAASYSGLTTVSSGILQVGNGGTTGSIAGNVTINNGGILDYDLSSSPVYASVLSGNGSLVKDGSGLLTLGGNANTFTGSVTINTGTLILSSTGSNTGPISSVSLVNSGALSLQNDLAIGSLTFGGNGATNTSTNSVNISAGKTLTLGGTVTYLATNNPAGASILGGTLALGGTRTFNVADSATTTSGAPDLFVSSAITGTGALVKSGAGLMGLSGVNTYSGGTTITDGILYVTSNTALPSGGNVAVNKTTAGGGSFLTINPNLSESIGSLMFGGPGSSGNSTNSVSIGSNSTLTLGGPLSFDATNNPPGATISAGTGGTLSLGSNVTRSFNIADSTGTTAELTISAPITGTGSSLIKTGGGTLVLSGASTYDGTTSISGGTVLINTTNALPTTTTVGFGSGASLDVAAGQLIAGFLNNTSFNSLITIESSKTLNITLGTAIFGTSFNGTITGAGTLEVGPSTDTTTTSSGVVGHTVGLFGNNTYTGGTIIDADGKILLGNNGSTGSIMGNVTIGDRGVLIFNLGNTSIFSGVISGNGTVSEGVVGGTTTGSIVLSGANTYTGGTTVYSKALIVGDGTTNGSIVGNVALSNNATVAFNRSDAVSFGGVVSGTGSLVKASTGTLTLTGQSTYSGGTNIIGGTLVVGAANALPTSTQLSLATGSTVEIANSQTIAGFFGNSTGSTLLLDLGKALTVAMPTANTFTTFAGNVSPNGPGTATFAVSGAGGDIVNLTGAVDGNITTSVGSGASLVIGSNPITVSTLLQFSSNSTQTLNNVLSGSGAILASGGNTTFTAPNTYTGGTVVSGGKLIVDNSSGSATGTGAVVVNTGGVLGGSGFISGAVVFNTGSVVSPGNSPGLLTVGPTTFAGSNTFAFDINNATGVAGTNWDVLAITGGLTISATSAAPVTISLVSLTGSNAAGLAQNFNSASAYSWQFLTTTTGINGFTSPAFTVDTSNFQNSTGVGFFFVSQSGNNLLLNFQPVPEPSTVALLTMGLGALAVGALRRRRAQK